MYRNGQVLLPQSYPQSYPQPHTLVGTIQEKPIFYWVYLYVTLALTPAFYLIAPKDDTSAGNVGKPEKNSRKYRWCCRLPLELNDNHSHLDFARDFT